MIALGVTAEGDKVPPGLHQGSTENATVCTALLNRLIERGLKIEQPLPCVVDGSKGIRKALRDLIQPGATSVPLGLLRRMLVSVSSAIASAPSRNA